MDSQIKKLLDKEQVCSLSVMLPGGSPHAAAVHFSYQEHPFRFFFQTSNTTLKAKALADGTVSKAAVVVGFSEEDWVTLQLRGNIRAVSDPAELEAIYKVHYQKQPQAEQYKGPKTVFLEFVPAWWRYTDFNTEPETIIES